MFNRSRLNSVASSLLSIVSGWRRSNTAQRDQRGSMSKGGFMLKHLTRLNLGLGLWHRNDSVLHLGRGEPAVAPDHVDHRNIDTREDVYGHGKYGQNSPGPRSTARARQRCMACGGQVVLSTFSIPFQH